MKCCTICGIEKALDLFEPQRRQCKACRSKAKLPYLIAYCAKNRDKALARAKKWRENNADAKIAARKAEYAKNAEAAKQASAEYRKQNPAKVNAWSRKHVLAKQKRTPAWLADDDFWLMEQAYEIANLRTKLFGHEWQVDHVIPLQGKLVSGLHVPHNLRVIPAYQNRSKSNKFVVT
jgi:hypothetical protein